MKKRIILLILCVLLVGQGVTLLVAVGSEFSLDRTIPAILIMFGVLMVIAILASGKIAKSVLSPFYQLQESIKRYMDGETDTVKIESKYKELEDISESFTDLAKKLNKYIYRSKQENQKSALILDNISEGIMVLDADMDVLLINSHAREIFGVEEDITNTNIIHFVRRQDVLNKLDKSYDERKKTTFDVFDEKEGKTYRFSTSIVRENALADGGDGMFVLISDVTDVILADKVRTDFTENVTNELKTPLEAIYKYAQRIEEEAPAKSGMQKNIAKLTDAADDLTGLINDTMQLAELNRIPIDERRVPLDLRKLATEVAGKLEKKAKKVDVTFSVEGNAEITANSGRIREMLANLCGNAIKYNKKGGKVDIVLEQDKDNAYVKIKDTGIGIPEEEVPRVFERFYRTDEAREINESGTGLGLAISKHIVQLYGGELTLNSRQGEGSEFVARFPLKKKRSSKK